MNTQATSRHFQIANGSAAIPFSLLAMVFCLTIISSLSAMAASWHDWDLSMAARAGRPGATPSRTFPRPYIRRDGISAVVYNGLNGSIHEMTLQ